VQGLLLQMIDKKIKKFIDDEFVDKERFVVNTIQKKNTHFWKWMTWFHILISEFSYFIIFC
jgi:hypothetical protein